MMWFTKRSIDGPVVVKKVRVKYSVTNGSSRKVDQNEYLARINWQEKVKV